MPKLSEGVIFDSKNLFYFDFTQFLEGGGIKAVTRVRGQYGHFSKKMEFNRGA